MSFLFLDEPGISVKMEGNRLLIDLHDGTIREYPIETVEGIMALKPVQFSAKSIQICLQKGIPIEFFTSGGQNYGHLHSFEMSNAKRQRLQCALYDSDFAVQFSKRITIGKIHNQEVVLRRYGKSRMIPVDEHIKIFHRCCEKIQDSHDIEEIMGNEGYAAKVYFAGLSMLIDSNFMFQGRSRRPARDEFNVLLNLGYSVLMNMVYGCLELRGLNPYFGLMHRDKEKHATLASDLMEEWRAVIVDTTAMAMINGHEIHKKDFFYDEETGEFRMTKEGLRLYLNKLGEKLRLKVHYIPNIPYSVSVRQGILLQIDSLIKAMEQEDTSVYQPVHIR